MSGIPLIFTGFLFLTDARLVTLVATHPEELEDDDPATGHRHDYRIRNEAIFRKVANPAVPEAFLKDFEIIAPNRRETDTAQIMKDLPDPPFGI